jgi:hypothetical protein
VGVHRWHKEQLAGREHAAQRARRQRTAAAAVQEAAAVREGVADEWCAGRDGCLARHHVLAALAETNTTQAMEKTQRFVVKRTICN